MYVLYRTFSTAESQTLLAGFLTFRVFALLQGSNGSFGPYYMMNLGLRVFELCMYMFTPIFTFNDAVHATETYPLAKA